MKGLGLSTAIFVILGIGFGYWFAAERRIELHRSPTFLKKMKMQKYQSFWSCSVSA